MAEERVQRRLAADVVGYSRLMGADEQATLATLKSHREVIDGLIAAHQGRIFGSAGDSVIAEFASPVEAVRCATEIQLEIDRRNTALPEERRMRFRIGVNLGEVMVEDDNLFGDGVNVAARLENLTTPGGINISGSVHEQVKSKLDVQYDDLGEQSVKNIAEPVRVYSVRIAPSAGQTMISVRRARTRGWVWFVLAAVVVVVVAGGGALWLRSRAPTDEPRVLETLTFPEIARPTRHFRVEQPANLADIDALR